MWRSWTTEPPRIPDVPLQVRLSDAPEMVMITTVAELRRLCAISDALEWKPSGQYREEIYQVTGQWH